MKYFIMAFIVWLGGKVFSFGCPGYKDDDVSNGWFWKCVCLIVFLCGIVHCCVGSDEEGEKAIKKVILTVTNRVEEEDCIYLRFSDGYTLCTRKPGHGDFGSGEQWYIVQKGDSVQKLIYPSSESKYTPVFDEHSYE